MLVTAKTLTTRILTAHPYMPQTTFVCNDILGVADVEELVESAIHRMQVGNPECSSTTRRFSVGQGGSGTGIANSSLTDHPFLGNSDRVPMYPHTRSNLASFSLQAGFPRYCLSVVARLQGANEFTTTNQFTGVGGEASWFDCSLLTYASDNAPASSQLINRFYQNQPFHLANAPAAIRQAPVTGKDIAWTSIEGTGFKHIVMIGDVEPQLFVPNAYVGGVLQFVLSYPLHPGGWAWLATTLNANTGGASCYVAHAPHPFTGIEYSHDGILDFELYFFR